MPTILYGVSPIGLGHATRASAVARELVARGFDVRFATGGGATEYLRSCGFTVSDIITEPVPKVVEGEMKNATEWYFRYWRGYGKSKRRMAAMITETTPALVVGDEEFSGVAEAKERRMKHVMISDELELGFARTWLARRVESRAERWYKRLQESVDLLILPEEGTDAENRRYVGPIVRPVTKSRKEVVAEHSLPQGGQMVLVSLSGTGLGGRLVRPSAEALDRLGGDAYVVIAGNRGERVSGERVHDLGVVNDNQNLVAAADLVISTAGKSTMDEAANSGTPLIAIPFRNHAEQERNAATLGYKPADIGRLAELVRSKVGRRTEPRSYEGAKKTAELLAGLVS